MLRTDASVPPACGLTLIAMFAVAVFGSAPTGQVIVPAVPAAGPVQAPPGADPETKSVEAATGSVTFTPVASFGPLLVIVAVNVNVSPEFMVVAEGVAVMARSTGGVTVMFTVADEVPPKPSATVRVTVCLPSPSLA